jgi:hypothetical protein
LYCWIAVDDRNQPGSVYYDVLGIGDRLGAIDPQCVVPGAVDDVLRHLAQ